MSDIEQKKILLVEDESIIAMAQKKLLERYGYEIFHTNNGESAIDIIENDQSIDLILMDINLGKGIDGTQAAERILRFKDIPIVFLSSHTEKAIVDLTEKITSYGYVVKNTGITILDASIKMAMKLFEEKSERKRTEEILRMSEEKFSKVFYTNPSIMSITTFVEGIFIDVNDAFLSVFGYEREEVVGKTSAELNIWADQNQRDVIIEEMKRKGQVNGVEVPGRTKNGDARYGLLSIYPLEIGNSKCLITVVNDITEHKLAEEKLRASELKYRTLVENIPQKIFIKDRNLVYLSCNDRYADDLSLQSEEIQGHTDFDFFPAELAEKYRADDRRIIESGTTERIEERYFEHGRERIVEILKTPIRNQHGEVIGILGIFHDITDRT